MQSEHRILINRTGATSLTKIKDKNRIVTYVLVTGRDQSELPGNFDSLCLEFYNILGKPEKSLSFSRQNGFQVKLYPEGDNFPLNYDFCTINRHGGELLSKEEIYLFYSPASFSLP
jgi:hypothetical protein